jgi:hypothetical protein
MPAGMSGLDQPPVEHEKHIVVSNFRNCRVSAVRDGHMACLGCEQALSPGARVACPARLGKRQETLKQTSDPQKIGSLAYSMS